MNVKSLGTAVLRPFHHYYFPFHRTFILGIVKSKQQIHLKNAPRGNFSISSQVLMRSVKNNNLFSMAIGTGRRCRCMSKLIFTHSSDFQ